MQDRGGGASSRPGTTSPRPATATTTTWRTWIGIAGDGFYRNGAGGRIHHRVGAWVDEHTRKKGPLGAFSPLPCCLIEGDTAATPPPP